jgi:hypothetical protein
MTAPGEHGPFALTLSMTLIALGKVDRGRFNATVEILKQQGGNPSLDARWKVIADVQNTLLGPENNEA